MPKGTDYLTEVPKGTDYLTEVPLACEKVQCYKYWQRYIMYLTGGGAISHWAEWLSRSGMPQDDCSDKSCVSNRIQLATVAEQGAYRGAKPGPSSRLALPQPTCPYIRSTAVREQRAA